VVVFCKPRSAIHEELSPLVATETILSGQDFPPAPISRCLRAFRRHGTQVAVSLLHMDLRLTGAAARLAGIPLVARRAEPEPLSALPWRRHFLHRLPRHWVAPSEANRRTLLASAPWLGDDQVTVIHNGIDPERFDGAEAADLGLPAGAVAIGYVGRLVEEKGLGELAAAWTRLAGADPRLHLVLAGEGGYEAELRRRLGKDSRVRWLGYRRDVPAVLAALDVVVLPSWEESFGIAAAEAMAAGRPVVATRTGGLAEVVGEDGGILVPCRDSDALAGALARLVADPDLRGRVGRAGRVRVVARFTEERMVAGFERLFASLVDD
jgi:glycosyltransferase involved in cell wall biosynthesis